MIQSGSLGPGAQASASTRPHAPGASSRPQVGRPWRARGPTHHDVAGLHGVHGGREAVLRLLVLLTVLEREGRQAPPGLQEPHRQAWGERRVSQVHPRPVPESCQVGALPGVPGCLPVAGPWQPSSLASSQKGASPGTADAAPTSRDNRHEHRAAARRPVLLAADTVCLGPGLGGHRRQCGGRARAEEMVVMAHDRMPFPSAPRAQLRCLPC